MIRVFINNTGSSRPDIAILKHLFSIILGILLLLSGVAQAVEEPPSRRFQTQAAVAAAQASLRQQIGRVSIGAGDWTIEQFVARFEDTNLLDDLTSKASQIGGPRWIDESTCQVQLELPAQKLAQAMAQLAESHPAISPIPAEALKSQLRYLQGRSFTATGTSATASSIAMFARPDPSSASWAAVTQADRRLAVEEATQDAIRRTIKRFKDAESARDPEIARVLTDEKASVEVERWIKRQPVSRVEFRDDRRVAVTLAVDENNLASFIRAANVPGEAVFLPGYQAEPDETARSEKFAAMLVQGVGPVATQTSLPPGVIQLPARAPAWTTKVLTAEGESPGSASRLRTVHEARQVALEKLRAQIVALRIDDELMIDQAILQSPRLALAVDRLLGNAKTHAIKYEPDGSATVQLGVDLHDLWDELTR